MIRSRSRYATAPPERRPLRIFSSDPMSDRAVGNRITIDVPYEPLAAGPAGARLMVVDYDSAHDCYYAPVNLEEPAILMRGGLEPSESDPRFHQQMVYAVGMRVIENFERALGRPIRFPRSRPLRVFPHAFYGANAFYHRRLNAILFGYFRADRDDPGPNLPGQNVFTCLSHDIIAHEMTHALVDRLRRYFLEPSNVDVLAFHEGFSDIVALFQHFSFEGPLREQIQLARADLRKPAALVELAQQFGYARGSGKALRSALGDPDRKLYRSVTEPHERGSILVAAVFDGFFNTYQRRIRDLVRIATGGTGNLPDADLHPDLVGRIGGEAAATAQAVLTMCIRAFDYLPPVDVTFGDYLRALVTADYELNPVDTYGLRAAMIDGFRLRGIFPDGVTSLAEESLILGCPEGLPPLPSDGLIPLLMQSIQALGRVRSSGPEGATEAASEAVAASQEAESEGRLEDINADLARSLNAYACDNAQCLGLDPRRKIGVGFHWVFRVGRNNQLLIELAARFIQTDDRPDTRRTFGGLPYRGGCSVIAAADGTIRYVIAKPLPSSGAPPEAQARWDRQVAFVRQCDRADPQLAWHRDDYLAERMLRRMSLAGLHQGMYR